MFINEEQRRYMHGGFFFLVGFGTHLFSVAESIRNVSVAESISLPYLILMNGANFSDSFSRFNFSLFTGLLPCGVVCTGTEGAIKTTSVFLVGENCLSTSLVTISKLSDFVVKASPTHSSIVSNSLSSSVEDLSRLAYLFVAFYVYGQRGWMIPSFCCMEED